MEMEITPKQMGLGCAGLATNLASIVAGLYCGYHESKGDVVDHQNVMLAGSLAVSAIIGYNYGMEMRKNRKTLDQIASRVPSMNPYEAKQSLYAVAPVSGIFSHVVPTGLLFGASYLVGKYVIGHHS